MFDERTFIANKQNQWQDLTNIVLKVKGLGLRRLPVADLARLGSLYRRTSADLAYARTQRATPELIYYLNELVGDAHGVLYVEHTGQSLVSVAANFFIYDLPDVLRRRMPFIATAFLLTVVGTLLAYFMVLHDPSAQNLFIPGELRDSVDKWKQGFADKSDISIGEGAIFSSALMTHNTGVGILAFATGITLLIPLYL